MRRDLRAHHPGAEHGGFADLKRRMTSSELKSVSVGARMPCARQSDEGRYLTCTPDGCTLLVVRVHRTSYPPTDLSACPAWTRVLIDRTSAKNRYRHNPHQAMPFRPEVRLRQTKPRNGRCRACVPYGIDLEPALIPRHAAAQLPVLRGLIADTQRQPPRVTANSSSATLVGWRRWQC